MLVFFVCLFFSVKELNRIPKHNTSPSPFEDNTHDTFHMNNTRNEGKSQAKDLVLTEDRHVQFNRWPARVEKMGGDV